MSPSMTAYYIDLVRADHWRFVLDAQKVAHTERKVALLLEFLMRDSTDGTVQVSIDDIADFFKSTPKTISGCLHRLVERGAVKLLEPAKSHQPARYAVDYQWANTQAIELEKHEERKVAEYWQMREDMDEQFPQRRAA